MGTFFQVFGKHGLKMWGTFLVGLLITQILTFFVGVLFYFVGAAVFLASAGIDLNHIQPGTPPEDIFSSAFNPGALLVLIVLYLLMLVVQLFIASFHMAGSCGMASEAVLDGSSSFGTYFQAAFRFFGRMFLQLVLIFLFSLPLLIPFVLSDLGMLFARESGNGIAFGIALLFWVLLLVAILLYSFGVMFAPVILTTENKGPWQSLRFSLRLLFRSFGKVLITGLLNIAIILPFVLLIGGLSALILPEGSEDPLTAIAGGLFLILLLFLTIPLAQAAGLLLTTHRYQRHLRQLVVPGEYGNDAGEANAFHYGKGFDPYDGINRENTPPDDPFTDPFLPPEENSEVDKGKRKESGLSPDKNSEDPGWSGTIDR